MSQTLIILVFIIIFTSVYGISAFGEPTEKEMKAAVQDSRKYFEEGKAKYESGKKKESISYFNKAIELNPKFEEAYFYRAEAKNSTNDWKGAVEDYSKVIEINPENIKAYKGRVTAQFLLEPKDYKQIINDLNVIIKKDPHDEEAYEDRARAKRFEGYYREAIYDCSRAIKINPNSDSAYTDRASLKEKIMNYRGAVDDYDKAIGIRAFDKRICENRYELRAEVKVDLKDYKGAVDDYNKAFEVYEEALKLYPELNEAWCTNGIKRLYDDRADAKSQLRDFKGAIEDYSKYMELIKEDNEPYLYTSALHNRGTLKMEIGDHKGAIEDFNKVMEIYPRRSGLALASRAEAKYALRDYTSAIEDYDFLINKFPYGAYYYFMRANAKYELNDYRGAIEDYSNAIRLYQKLLKMYLRTLDGIAKAYYNRGLARDKLNDHKAALKDYTAAGDLNPKYRDKKVDKSLTNILKIDDKKESGEDSKLNEGILTEKLLDSNDYIEWGIIPLIPGKWFEPTEQVANMVLDKLISDLSEDDKFTPSQVKRLRALKLPFYPTATLYEGMLDDDNVFTFVKHKNGFSIINGDANVIYELNKIESLVLDDPEDAKLYLKFFCAALEASEGNFLVIDNINDLSWMDGATEKDREITLSSIKPIEIYKKNEDTWAANGSMRYADQLFLVSFEIDAKGHVEMFDDNVVVKNLPIKETIFDGPVRSELE